nr:type VI secretion system ImpA family N-terminal domain-containing protein [uncultured Cohaesibacter sp.]
MEFEYLLAPITDEKPCGPDLEEAGDEDFFTCVMGADGRLPEKYYDVGRELLFDRTSIDLKKEMDDISAILERSRDIRALTLAARFQILSGSILGFAAYIEAIARLLEVFWQDVHPGADGDFSYRQIELEVLESHNTCLQPLRYAPIINDSRVKSVSLRRYQLANQLAEPHPGEEVPDASALTTALANLDNLSELQASYDALTGCVANLAAIRSAYMNEGKFDATPSFQQLTETLNQIIDFLVKEQPFLAGADAVVEGGQTSEEGVFAQADTVELTDTSGAVSMHHAVEPTVAGVATPSALAGIDSHAAAEAALEAVERYFVIFEPSSPALILVKQARMLVGRPLVEAIEMLMPSRADDARIQLGSNEQMKISMSRMRVLSERALDDANTNRDAANESEFEVETRASAQELMSKLEGYFKSTEPSSAIPILLQKSRTYLNKDFASILGDLIV